MSAGLGLDAWMGTAVESLAETASTSLGLAPTQVVAESEALPHGLVGSTIPLVADRAVQLGLFATSQGCEDLARLLLGMGPDDGPLAEPDVADGMGEILNILAGVMKRHMANKGASLSIGLPMFVHGYIEQGGSKKARTASLKLGDHEAQLFILGSIPQH
ncbi:MAG: chemotaxis protein CheX [Polyangiales bacterium]